MLAISSSPSLPPEHSRWSRRQRDIVTQLAHDLTVPASKLEELAHEFCRQMGIALNPGRTRDLVLIPTFVSTRPDGSERGCRLALDLGSTNFRVYLVTVKEGRVLESHSRAFEVPVSLQQGYVSELMDFVAISIKEFINSDYVHNQITTHLTDTETLKLGFTSSFSVSHTAIDSGILLRWARGSQCSGAVGNDIVQLLQSALGRNGVNICCAALVNVAVGSLLTQAYNYPSKFTAAILTSGATGAYIEDTRNIRTPQSDASEMLISIDWGNFDKDKHILPVTIFDNKLDRESTNPGFQVFEKMVSGMYLGEITRNILLHLIDHRALFDGTSSPILNRSWSFLTKHMSDIERDRTPMLIPTAQLLEHELEIKFNTLADRQVLKYVCQLVGKRAARLSAMVAAALIRQMLEKGCLRDRGYTLRTSQESYSYLSRSNHGSSNNHGRAGVQSNSAPASLSSTSSATSTTSSSGGQPSSHATPIHVGVESSVYELYPDFKTNMKEALVEILGPSANETVVLDTARDGFGIGAALATMETSMTLSGEARSED